MRRAIGLGAMGCGFLMMVAAQASAAEKGQFGIHLGAEYEMNDYGWGGNTVAPSLAFSYQATDRLSLRPSLALAHSSSSGWHFGLGGTALYHLRPHRKLSPYVGAGFRFRDLGPVANEPWMGDLQPDLSSRKYSTFSVMVGAEYSVTRRLSVFGEAEGLYSTGRHYRGEGNDLHLGSGRFEVRPVVGLTLKLR